MLHVMSKSDYTRACADETDDLLMARLASNRLLYYRYENAMLVRKVRRFRFLACAATYALVSTCIWSYGILYEFLLTSLMLSMSLVPGWLGFTEVDPWRR